MREDARREMLERINGEKSRILVMKDKAEQLKKLEEIPVIQEYLTLKKEVEELAVINDRSILEEKKEEIASNFECEHDICLFTQYSMFANNGVSIMAQKEESLLGLKATHAEFYCLDCARYIAVSLERVEAFMENHRIINPLRPFSADTFKLEVWNLKEWRNHYFELLLEYSSDDVYQMLKQEYDDGALMRRRK